MGDPKLDRKGNGEEVLLAGPRALKKNNLDALPSAPLSFSIVLHFLPALDPLPMSDNLELVF